MLYYRDELSNHKLGLIEEEEKRVKGENKANGEDGEKKVNGTLDPEVRSCWTKKDENIQIKKMGGNLD